MNDFKQYLVQDLDEATHWIPEFDDHHDGFANVVIGKPYKLFVSEYDGEICIHEEDGVEVPTFIYHKGHLVKLPDHENA